MAGYVPPFKSDVSTIHRFLKSIYIYIYIYYTIRRKIIVKTQLLYVSRGATLFLQDVENIRQSSESLIFRHYPTTVIPRKIAFYMSYVISRR